MADAQATDDAPIFPPGARVLVRDAEWLVRTSTRTAHDGAKIDAVGVSEFVRDTEAVFFTGLDHATLLRPEDTKLVADDTPAFSMSRLYLEAVLRRTPLPQSERGLAMTDGVLMDPLIYQRRPAELALRGLRPRILLADVVGLGKTLEIGLILAELIRRGRGERILVVTPQQVLEQFQHELWTRFSIPLVRLDSVGVERIQRDIPAGRNPFSYYKRVIVSVDTLKNHGKYGRHLENMHWDAVVIDESHNLMGRSTDRNRLAKLLSHHTDALLLASATPHNGDSESFAELIGMLDPAAIADPACYSSRDIDHLYLRRTKISPEVREQIGARWPERGPTRSVRCPASPAEERVFAEFARVWLPGDGTAPVPARRRLFCYTLLKAYLSSHVALGATVNKRIETITDARDELRPGEHEPELTALRRLAELTGRVRTEDSTKLAALLTELHRIGVRPDSATRVVVFSESVPTVEWLRDELRARLGFAAPDAVEIMHGGLADTKQQEVVEKFSLRDGPIRVLVASDVFSEGVNLHRQCHQLIHYDLPWSLIRIEQRNGRIDRYNQAEHPMFTALITTSDVPGAKDDTTVAEKLLHREEQAHRTLGTVEPVTGLHSATKEEDRLIQDLLNGKTVEKSLDETAAAGGFMAELLGQAGPRPDRPEPAEARVPSLFGSTQAFVREALDLVHPDAARTLDLDDDGALIAFNPPDDLVRRLSALPRSYLRTVGVAKRMRVTFDQALARRKLDEARDTSTLWPDIGYLSDLHPMVEWLVDKVLVRLARGKAPVLRAAVPRPTFLVQGVYSNRLGRPTVVEWMAIDGLPDEPQTADMAEVLEQAGVGPAMINTQRPVDRDGLERLIPAAVHAGRAHLEKRRSDYDERIAAPLADYRARLAHWEQLSLTESTGAQRDRTERRVRATVTEQQHLVDALRTTGEPLLRVLAVLVGPE